MKFKTEIYEYHNTGSFRHWCQHVLPLVYDDSLSYYELLCKVVHYLNDVIQNVDGLNENFKILKAYVENYFDSHDFEEIINTKLDEMAEDGTLSALINDIMKVDMWFIGRIPDDSGEHYQDKRTQGFRIIKTPANKVIVIDTGWSTSNTGYLPDIKELTGTDHIDVLILTHFHKDHVGNLANLLAAYDTANCQCYIPPVVPDKCDNELLNNQSVVVSLLSGLNVDRVNFNTFTIDGITIDFYNTNHLQYYGEGEDLPDDFNYNDCCICPMLTYYDRKLFIASDIAFKAQNYLATVLPSVTVSEMAHHGYNEYVSKPYVNRIQPDVAIILNGDGIVNVKDPENPGAYADYPEYVNEISTENWYHQNRGIKIFTTSKQTGYILHGFMSRNNMGFDGNALPHDRITYHYSSFNEIFDNTWRSEEARTKTIYQVLNAMHNNSTVEGLLGSRYFFVPRNITGTCYMKITKTNTGYVSGSYGADTYAVVEVINFTNKADVERQVYNFYHTTTGWQLASRNDSMGNFYRYDVNLPINATNVNLGNYTYSFGNDLTQTGTALSSFVALVTLTVNAKSGTTGMNCTVNFGSASISVVGSETSKTVTRIATINKDQTVRCQNNGNNEVDVDLLIVPLGYSRNWTRNTLFPTEYTPT